LKEESRVRVFENGVLSVFENRLLRVKVLSVFENRLLRVRVLRG